MYSNTRGGGREVPRDLIHSTICQKQLSGLQSRAGGVCTGGGFQMNFQKRQQGNHRCREDLYWASHFQSSAGAQIN